MRDHIFLVAWPLFFKILFG